MSLPKVAIVGASGYTGGELLRLLLAHPGVEVSQVTSESLAGKSVSKAHPNLRGARLDFCSSADLRECDVLFSCLPHGVSAGKMIEFLEIGARVIDLSADFRLRNAQDYVTWYGFTHPTAQLLGEAVYGLTELHREQIRKARLIATGGCIASATILALAPLAKAGVMDAEHVVVDAKIGSSAAGSKATPSTHYTERFGVVRSFAPTMHRHTAEIEQELGFVSSGSRHVVSLSPHAIDIVRGILSTCHVFLNRDLSEKDVWRIYRDFYGGEPFIRFVKEKTGNYRYPEPKLLNGLNYCDIGFEKDGHSNRLVVMSAIDNLVKGAAGQAVQDLNVILGLDEKTGLTQIALHP